VRDDKRMITRITADMGNLRVSGVTRQIVQRLHASMKSTPYLANRVLALLSKMFNLATDWGWIEANPCHGISRFHEDQRERWLQPEELRRLTEALRGYHDQNAANALRLLLLTGSRKTEVLSAEWSMFDLARGLWTKPSSHTKEKKVEHIPLSAEALALLKQLRTENSGGRFLFPGLGDQPRTTVRAAWVAICNRAQLPALRIHDLRHSYASYLVSHGVSLHIVGKLLGHTQPQTTQRYAHVANQSLRDASNVFGDIFRAAGEHP
jgi:integrase